MTNNENKYIFKKRNIKVIPFILLAIGLFLTLPQQFLIAGELILVAGFTFHALTLHNSIGVEQKIQKMEEQ